MNASIGVNVKVLFFSDEVIQEVLVSGDAIVAVNLTWGDIIPLVNGTVYLISELRTGVNIPMRHFDPGCLLCFLAVVWILVILLLHLVDLFNDALVVRFWERCFSLDGEKLICDLVSTR